MAKVNPTAKLPLKTFIGKGSYDKRLMYAKKLNADFFKLTNDEFKKGSISIIDYKKALMSLLPPNIKLHVSCISKTEMGCGTKACVSHSLTNDEVKFSTVYFPYMIHHGKKNKNARISTNIKGTVAHENFHIFASLCNPKHEARSNSFLYNDFEIYEQCLYGPNARITPSRIKIFLKHLKSKTIEEKINFLQACRYHLIEENIAYSEETKYQYVKYNIPEYSFVEKILVLEKLLAYYIRKARNQHKKLIDNANKSYSSWRSIITAAFNSSSKYWSCWLIFSGL